MPASPGFLACGQARNDEVISDRLVVHHQHLQDAPGQVKQQLPSVGQSPSPAPAQSRLKHLRQQRAPPDTATVAGEPTASEVESELDFEDEGRLCDRLNLPHGVTGVEGRVSPSYFSLQLVAT